ncbi:hypothetical protein V6N13_148218 [Hibiscus sabdariffa]
MAIPRKDALICVMLKLQTRQRRFDFQKLLPLQMCPLNLCLLDPGWWLHDVHLDIGTQDLQPTTPLSHVSIDMVGCGDSGFFLAAKEFLRDNRPDLVVFVEPRISGRHADILISVVGFQHSHLVEAIGFTRGIWVAWSGCAQSSKPNSAFQNLLFDYGLRDMGYQGPSYTWSRGSTFVHLDRFICNSYYDETYHESIVQHFLRMRSDHRPIFLTIGRSLRNNRQSSFHYFFGWQSYVDFSLMVTDNWVVGTLMSATLQLFVMAVDT